MSNHSLSFVQFSYIYIEPIYNKSDRWGGEDKKLFTNPKPDSPRLKGRGRLMGVGPAG